MIQAQKGPQEDFLATTADIAIYGGAAGGGKSYALLMEPLRHKDNKLFSGVIFRRESPQITNPGALWDESQNLYAIFGADPKISRLEWQFPEGMKMKFAHLALENDVFAWQGAQVPFIGFDELTHFTLGQFTYMLSRLRSSSGVPGYVRATCNPDPDSFVAKLVDWWIDKDGFPIKERSGVLRWFIRRGDEFIWSDTREGLQKQFPLEFPLSLTFIGASIYDNEILLKNDPQYLANLMGQDRVQRARLLSGNWKVRPAAGMYFKKSYFEFIDAENLPARRTLVRYWDMAATKKKEGNDPDWTSGVRMSRDNSGLFYVEHVERLRETPGEVEKRIKNIASSDGKQVTIGKEIDPGSAGKFEADYYVRALSGYSVKTNPAREDKVSRASPFSSQAEHGNVKIVRGAWNDAYISELENFPSKDKDDQVDASSGAFKLLNSGVSGEFKIQYAEKDRTKEEW